MSNSLELDLSNNEIKEYNNLHIEIIHCGKSACESMIELAKNLKKMRDDELYKIGGFYTFTEYVENAVGIKERQAYKYIKIYEDLPEEFLHSSAKLGITKLNLLSALSDDERINLLENNNIEDLSVKNLKEEINNLKNKNEDLNKNFNSLKDIQLKASKTVAKLTKEKAELLKQIEEIKKQEKEVVTVIDKSLDEKIKELELSLQKKENEIDSLNKKLNLNDDILIKFKVKFHDLQVLGQELISLINNAPGDKQSNLKKAIFTVVEGWNLYEKK